MGGPYRGAVPFDEAVAARIRRLVAHHTDVTEQRMFGGLAFLIHGHMAVAVSGRGELLVRVDPDERDALVAVDGARPMEMRGRPMRGWVEVDREGIVTDADLARWVEVATTVVTSLPPKSPKPPRSPDSLKGSRHQERRSRDRA